MQVVNHGLSPRARTLLSNASKYAWSFAEISGANDPFELHKYVTTSGKVLKESVQQTRVANNVILVFLSLKELSNITRRNDWVGGAKWSIEEMDQMANSIAM